MLDEPRRGRGQAPSPLGSFLTPPGGLARLLRLELLRGGVRSPHRR
jgi:hypothetical protein